MGGLLGVCGVCVCVWGRGGINSMKVTTYAPPFRPPFFRSLENLYSFDPYILAKMRKTSYFEPYFSSKSGKMYRFDPTCAHIESEIF